MAQADLSVANQSFPAFRADLNNQLLALGTQQSGATAPSTTYPYMLWADTSTGLLKIRNAANSAWVTLHSLDGLAYYTQYISQPADNSAVTISGGATGGANIELHGPSSGSANNAFYDATTHTFRSADGLTQFGQLFAGSLQVGGAGTATTGIEIGPGPTGNRYSYIDFIGDTTYSDYGLRINRNSTGPNTASALLHRGTGPLLLAAEDGGSVVLFTNGSGRVVVDSTGLATFYNGVSGAVTRGTAVTPGAVTSVTFSSIPNWVKQVTLHFSGISLSGTDHFLIRLSTGGTFASSGYNSSSNFTTVAGATGGTSSTAGAVLFGNATANNITGSYTFTNITGNTWIGTGLHIYDNDAQFVGTEASKVTLGGTLDGIRILSSGSNTFDAGTINVTYSG
jgi:hypothetical protein